MATKTFEELKQLAIQIRDEKTNKQNTATRIGTQMLEHLDKLEQDYYDKTATDEELKERDEKLTELEENGKENKRLLGSTLSLPFNNGGRLNSGNFIATSDGVYYTTDFYPCKKGDIFVIDLYTGSGANAVNFYDTNKSFIEDGRLDVGKFVQEVVAPIDGFVRFCSNRNIYKYLYAIPYNIISKIKEIENNLNTKVSYDYYADYSFLTDGHLTQKSEYNLIYGNKIDINGYAYGVAWLCTKSDSFEEVSVYKVTPYEGVASLSLIKTFAIEDSMVEGNIYNLMFDEPEFLLSNDYIGVLAPIRYVSKKENGAKYPNIHCNPDGTNYGSDEYIDIGILVITGLGGISRNYSDNTSLRGKKISVIGDSISTYDGIDGVSYPYYPKGDINNYVETWWGQLLSLSGATMCRVNAIGGSMVSTGGDRTPMIDDSRCLQLYSNGDSGETPDIIIILGGINDYGTKTPLGSFDNDFKSTDFYFIPAYRHLLYKIQEKYPKTLIIGCTPIRSVYEGNTYYPLSNGNYTLEEVCDAIKKACSWHGVKCIDFYNNIPINEFNISYKMIDGVHPKKSTCTEMAKFALSEIKKII